MEGQRDEYIAYELSLTHILCFCWGDRINKDVKFGKIVSFKNYPCLYLSTSFLIRDLSFLCTWNSLILLQCLYFIAQPTDSYCMVNAIIPCIEDFHLRFTFINYIYQVYHIRERIYYVIFMDERYWYSIF